MVERGVMI